MRQRIFLGGLIPVDNISMDDVLSFVRNCLEDSTDGTARIIVAQNATKAAILCRDSQFGQQMNQADILIPDGTAILLSAKILGCPVTSRITGIDVMEGMLNLANSQKRKVFFLGAEEKVRFKLIASVKSRFPDLVIAGAANGYFSNLQQAEIINAIDNTRPDMLFVALGSPRQENWLFTNRSRIRAKICIGVGGSFDIIAGLKARAPHLLRTGGLEAIYRILREPRRILRLRPYVTLAHFTAESWLKNHKSFKM